MFRRLMTRLDGRIAVSEAARDYVGGFFPGDYRVIPNGVDLECFGQLDAEPVPRFHNQRPKILFVGRLEKRKGFAHLLNAFAAVHAALPDAQLIVAGAYDRKQAAPYILQARAGHLSSVAFLGWQPDDNLARLYRTADVMCAPSTGFESFGMVLVEAMAAGRPVVASNIAGYREVVRDGIDGLLVPPGDEAALARALVRLLSDKELQQYLGQNGRARASRFAWSYVADEVLAYYHELNEQRGLDSWHSSSKKPET
jgi:phosphatidylinositol alpha-mannosyltransferase